MLADRLRPARSRRPRAACPSCAVLEEVRQRRGCSRAASSSRTVSKYGSGFQMPGVVAFCGTGAQNIASSSQSGCVALRDVVAPADVVLVQQVGEVGPGVVRRAAPVVLPRLPGGEPGSCTRDVAAHRIALLVQLRRPAGDHEQVRGQAPRRVRLEHVVLEHEVPRVGPVVRDLARVVVAHHVGRARQFVQRGSSRSAQHFLRRRSAWAMKPSILPPSMSAHRVAVAVRAAAVAVGRVVVRLHAAAARGSGTHDGRLARRASGSRRRRDTCRSRSRTSGSPA